MSESTNSFDELDLLELELDNDPYYAEILNQRMVAYQKESEIDRQKLEEEIILALQSFLRSSTIKYTIIGGRAVMRYVDDKNLSPSEKILLQSFDYDILVYDSQVRRDQMVILASEEITNKLKESGMGFVKLVDRILPAVDVVQIGYELNNSIKFFADFHFKKEIDLSIVKIDGLYYPTTDWILQELVDTMNTESEMKSLKRYTRHRLLQSQMNEKNL
jgi:hypothetical protein